MTGFRPFADAAAPLRREPNLHVRAVRVAVALESYAAAFDEEGALDRLEGFASEYGPRFYGLPLNTGTITLERGETWVPDLIDADGVDIVPFHAGETLGWRLRVG